jgi:hypothetical protein
MPATERSTGRKSRTELQSWYLGSLRPKLTNAARSGLVAAGAAAALDQELLDFLGLPDSEKE